MMISWKTTASDDPGCLPSSGTLRRIRWPLQPRSRDGAASFGDDPAPEWRLSHHPGPWPVSQPMAAANRLPTLLHATPIPTVLPADTGSALGPRSLASAHPFRGCVPRAYLRPGVATTTSATALRRTSTTPSFGSSQDGGRNPLPFRLIARWPPSRGSRWPSCEPCASHPGRPFAVLPRALARDCDGDAFRGAPPSGAFGSASWMWRWTCAGRRTERRTRPLVRWRMAPRAGLRAHGATLTTFPSSATFEHPLSPVRVVGRGGTPHRRRRTSRGRLLRAIPRRLTRSGRPGCFPPCAAQVLGGSLPRAYPRRPPAHAATHPP